MDESIAMASMYLANHFRKVKAIACLTESGSTALWMSRIKTHLPLVAMSSKQATLNAVALYKGVIPAHLPHESQRNDQLMEIIQYMRNEVDVGPRRLCRGYLRRCGWGRWEHQHPKNIESAQIK